MKKVFFCAVILFSAFMSNRAAAMQQQEVKNLTDLPQELLFIIFDCLGFENTVKSAEICKQICTARNSYFNTFSQDFAQALLLAGNHFLKGRDLDACKSLLLFLKNIDHPEINDMRSLLQKKIRALRRHPSVANSLRTLIARVLERCFAATCSCIACQCQAQDCCLYLCSRRGQE